MSHKHPVSRTPPVPPKNGTPVAPAEPDAVTIAVGRQLSPAEIAVAAQAGH